MATRPHLESMGCLPVERLTAFPTRGGRLRSVQVTRVMFPGGVDVSVLVVSGLVRRGVWPVWRDEVTVATRRVPSRDDATTVAVDPGLAWSCDRTRCRVISPTLGLSLEATTWNRSRIGAWARLPAGAGGLSSLRRVTVRRTGDGGREVTLSEESGDLAGRWPGVLTVWPSPADQVGAGAHRRGEFPATAWAEPAMRSRAG